MYIAQSLLCAHQLMLLPGVFMYQPLTVLTRQTRLAVHAIDQSIFYHDVYGPIQ